MLTKNQTTARNLTCSILKVGLSPSSKPVTPHPAVTENSPGPDCELAIVTIWGKLV